MLRNYKLQLQLAEYARMDLLFSLSNDCLYPSRKPRTFLQNGLYSYFQCYQIAFQHFVVVGLYGQQPIPKLRR